MSEYRTCSVSVPCRAKGVVIEFGASETSFVVAVAKWVYGGSCESTFCWRSLESVLASVELEALVLEPELRDGAETEEDEPEEDTPELLREFEELVAGALDPAMGEETLLVGVRAGNGRASVATCEAMPGDGI